VQDSKKLLWPILILIIIKIKVRDRQMSLILMVLLKTKIQHKVLISSISTHHNKQIKIVADP